MTVLVTDAGGNHALAVVRSLGRRGIRVVAADSMWCAKAAFSRYCAARALYPPATRGVADFLAGVLRILERVKPDLLMPMTERTILGLLTGRDAVESRARLAPLPSEEALGIAFDKEQTLRLARSLGIPAPRTIAPRSLDEVAALRKEVSYPAVIKPRRSEIATADDRIVPGGTAAYCFRASDLEARYLAVHRRAPLPLIQEYVPGQGYGISALCVRGRLRVLFAHRRLRTIRPTGSGSALRESVPPPPAMLEAAESLLGALRWHGVAMVEFKLDPRDGRPKLMEINGRFWNSLPLAIAAGVDFPFLLYRLATEGDVPERFAYRPGVRCRWLVGDAQHLARALRGRPAGWPDSFPSRARSLLDFVKFFGRDLHYDDPWLSDPAPFLAELADLAVRCLPGLLPRRGAPPVVEAAPAETVRAGAGAALSAAGHRGGSAA
jgi:predicted ATP-grasp superfamily ATP-dependent carboligase